MDEKLQAQIAEAKANGYTDEQIDAFLSPKPVERLDEKKDESGKPVSPYVDRHEEAVGIGQYGLGKAAELGAEAAATYFGGKKLLTAAGNAFRGPQGIAAVQPGQSPNMTGPTNTPVAPTSAPLEPGGQKLTDFVQQKGNYARPPAPVGGPIPGQPVAGAPQSAGIGKDLISSGQRMAQTNPGITQQVQKLALEKLLPAARLAGGVTAAVTPGNAGQNYGAHFPQTGPQSGSEINPQTGRPWTQQELAQYSQTYR